MKRKSLKLSLVSLALLLTAAMSGCGGSEKPSESSSVVPFAAKQPAGQVQLSGNKIPQFVDSLPLLSVAGGPIETVVAGTSEITVSMWELQAQMMPSTFVPANGQPYTGTWMFGYRLGVNAPTGPVSTPVGPIIVATRNQPTQIKYINNLTANNVHWRDWTDRSLHSAFDPMAMPGELAHFQGSIPAVPHLHGGEVPGVIDGGPEAWFSADGLTHGDAYYAGPGGGGNTAVYRYPNSQEAGPLWFHDHLLGGTRLNATFGGLAGAYPIIDPNMTLPGGLHPVGLQRGAKTDYLIPLVIQDRMFDTNGQLLFPNVGVNPEHPYWAPEFVGDTIIVNGKVWPYLNVDQQRYRFFLINGSNSRPYDMFLQDTVSGVKGPRMWVIATDGGYLDSPVLIDPNATGAQTKAGVQKSLMMMPGERYEIIIDFADPVWKALLPKNEAFPLNLILRNTGETVDGNPNANTDGRIMQFRVSANTPAPDTSYDPAGGIPIRTGANVMKRLANASAGTLATGVTATKTRELTLVEVPGAGGPMEALVNNSGWEGRRPDGTPIPGSILVNGNYTTELPVEGDTEVWEIVNTTADAHPIHLHGVQFQILNRQEFDTDAFDATFAAAFPGGAVIYDYGPPLSYTPSAASGNKYGGNPDVTPFLAGAAIPPATYESGWKDTAIMPSGMVTRIAVRFAPQEKAIGAADLGFPFQPDAAGGYYVWHCHITDHEDNEMMRPDVIVSKPGATRTYKIGTDF